MHRIAFLLLVVLSGCSDRPAGKASGEEAVRQAFVAFQTALKERKAEQMWDLLDTESQADAEQAAQAIRSAYMKATPAEKAEQEKALGLSGAELAELKGPGFLRTRRFHGKYDELPDSKIDKIVVQGNSATVSYVEPDGDQEKLTLLLQQGQWKPSVPMPRTAR